ncbi:MAG: galactose-1-phosphate uridylyltransferase [bacterium]
MSEIRQNIAIREWVIIASERARRPHEFIQKKQVDKETPDYMETCPFCPGNEHLAPPEVFSLRDDRNEWLVRCIPNKFPAVSAQGTLIHQDEGIKRRLSGVGLHEVIVETPHHSLATALMDEQQVIKILETYKCRYLEALGDKRIELVIIFKNHGQSAGTSLEHPHSQLIAIPVVPQHVRDRMEEAMRFYDDHRRCVFCEMLKEEIKLQERVILESADFVAFTPYAALSPFHTWILPKRHMSSFTQIDETEMRDFAGILRKVLKKIYVGLNDPDFNYVIRSIPAPYGDTSFFHWYLSIVPRVSLAAGFELGSGMFINTSIPEENAEFLKGIAVD